MFERFITWFSVEFTAELEGSEIRREFIFRDASVGREPRVARDGGAR